MKIRLVRWLDRPDRCYFLVALSAGLMFLIITPPFQVPDEPSHLYRCYQLSEGHIFPEKRDGAVGGEIPRAVVDTVQDIVGDPGAGLVKPARPSIILSYLDYHPPKGHRRIFVSFPNSALYSPIPYAPAAAGVSVGRLFGLAPLWSLYAGRLATLLSTVLICTWAIRITPVFSCGFFLIATTPMFITLTASVSADAVTNALSILLTALVLKHSFSEGQVGTRDLALLMGLSVALALCKSVYVILSVLFFVIPRERIGSQRRYAATALSVLLASFGASFMWIFAVANMFAAHHWGGFSNLSEPAGFVSNHPLLLAQMVVVSMAKHFLFYVRSGIGYLGWTDTPMPGALIIAYALLTVAAALGGGSSIRFSLRQKLVLAAVAIAGTVVVMVSQFFLWSEPGSTTIQGVQGRYFIPFVALYFLLVHNNRTSSLDAAKKLNRLIPVIVAVLLLFAGWFAVQGFYSG